MNPPHALLTLIQASVPPVYLPPTITREHIDYLRNMAAVQVFTALCVQVMMILGVFAAISLATGFRKTSMVFVMLMGLAMTPIPSGYSFFYGVTIICVTIAGLLWGFIRGRA
jgi:hypothetical protein